MLGLAGDQDPEGLLMRPAIRPPDALHPERWVEFRRGRWHRLRLCKRCGEAFFPYTRREKRCHVCQWRLGTHPVCRKLHRGQMRAMRAEGGGFENIVAVAAALA